ncbi:MAG: ribonuclease HI family protein [Actinomycetota bacterium]|nr:ribonuclease HI family protein [Actinomycetota bacterium]
MTGGRCVLRTDGGARGNPGPAGAGFVLADANGARICGGGRFLGETTNNIAEYEALLWGLRSARARGCEMLTVYSDSELVVKQLNGQYRVKHPNMQPLYAKACSLLAQFRDVKVVHVRREENAEADALANQAMDARETVGDADDPCVDVQATLFD